MSEKFRTIVGVKLRRAIVKQRRKSKEKEAETGIRETLDVRRTSQDKTHLIRYKAAWDLVFSAGAHPRGYTFEHGLVRFFITTLLFRA